MIEPASLGDWTSFAGMTACLGAYAVLGYRWVLGAEPAAIAEDRRKQPLADRRDLAA
jgi:hypothetical protein